MTKKEMRRMSKLDLLSVLVDQMELNERLEKENKYIKNILDQNDSRIKEIETHGKIKKIIRDAQELTIDLTAGLTEHSKIYKDLTRKQLIINKGLESFIKNIFLYAEKYPEFKNVIKVLEETTFNV